MDKINIMIVGVGGQGSLLTSRILGNVGLREGYDVKVSEVHGMSQRGGSVVTYVKMAKKVFSPLIEKGEADIILAFEELEALRWVDYVKEDGRMIINAQKIDPLPVIIGKAKYPENIVQKIQGYYPNTISIDALVIALQSGSIKTVNTVLIGVMAKLIDIPKKVWIEAIEEIVPAKMLESNLKAFEAGFCFC
jgi:indolepyruvate ferredoxin oxidoreductase beta subunit